MFFGLPYDRSLCCAACIDCRPLTYVGSYLGWVRCGGEVVLCRLPEVVIGSAAIAAYDDETGLHTRREQTEYVEVPDIESGGTTYRCVSVAGSQCSDGSWIKSQQPNYAWYQLNFAPTNDLATTAPRAGLARVRIHDATYGAIVTDPINREFTLVDCWLANDESGDPFYWDAEDKLCQYYNDGAPKVDICVGSQNFAIVTRRSGGSQGTNSALYWTANTSTATLKTWDNPEVGDDSGANHVMAAFDRHAFPWGTGMRTEDTYDMSELVSRSRTMQHGPANLGTMVVDTTDDAAKPGSGDTYNVTAQWSTIPPDAVAIGPGVTALWVQDYAGCGAYVSIDEADIVPFYTDDEDPTRWLYQGIGIYQLSAKTINSNQHALTSAYEGAEGETAAERIQFMSAGYDQGAGYNHALIHPQATITGVAGYSSETAEAVSKRVWAFPGNHRCGWQRTYWSYSDEDNNNGGIGAFVTLIQAGDAYWPFDTFKETYATDRLFVYSLLANDFGTGPYYWAIDANPAATGISAPLQVHTSAYSHTGEESGFGKAIKPSTYVLHNWPLSLLPTPYTIDAITYEPDAVDMGQAVEPFYEALDLIEWNNLAHETPGTTDTRWCYFWVGIGSDLYPMVKIRADGRWEPRRPPRGEWWASGVLQQAYSLGWDNSPDAKSPVASLWPATEEIIVDE